MITLTDRNFEKEVLKAGLPVFLYFWAPWCVAPDSKVSIDSRESIPAGEVSVGQKLLSFTNKKGNSSSKVSYSRLVSNRGHCKLIKTESNREIKATNGHQFWTQDGWKAAQELRQGDKIAVFPSVKFLKLSKNRTIILDEEDIRKVSLPRMRIERYIRELKKKNLLPLRVNNEKLPILARLIGLCLTDGGLYHSEKNNYREISFSVGDKKDIQFLKNDLFRLGFLTHSRERASLHEIEGRKFKMHTFRIKCLSSALWLLFRALEVPEGNKTNQAYGIPFWLFRSPKLVKREFLAGFLGGDGPKLLMHLSPRKKGKPYNSLTINDLEFYKREDLADAGISLAKQLSELLAEFGVEVTRIFLEKVSYLRQDKTKTIIIHLRFRQTFVVGWAMARRIGYAYCKQKNTAASQLGEFLGRILAKRKDWKEVHQEAIKLEKEEKLAPSEIAERLNISEGAAWGWLRYNQKPTIKKHFEKYPQWLSRAREGLLEGFLWDIVAGVESTYLPVVQRIMVDKTHNFIANEFVVHNCGPCLIASPVIEELAEEYEGKIEVGKLNVDENPKMAQKYGIMSIPTVVVFQDGKEAGRKIGFPRKKGYEDLIEETIK